MTKRTVIVKKAIAGYKEGEELFELQDGQRQTVFARSRMDGGAVIHEDFISLLPDYFKELGLGSVWNSHGRYLKASINDTLWIISQNGDIYNRNANQEMCDKVTSGFLEAYKTLELANQAKNRKELLFRKDLHDNGLCDCTDEERSEDHDEEIDDIETLKKMRKDVKKQLDLSTGLEGLFLTILLKSLDDKINK